MAMAMTISAITATMIPTISPVSAWFATSKMTTSSTNYLASIFLTTVMNPGFAASILTFFSLLGMYTRSLSTSWVSSLNSAPITLNDAETFLFYYFACIFTPKTGFSVIF